MLRTKISPALLDELLRIQALLHTIPALLCNLENFLVNIHWQMHTMNLN